MKNFYAILKIIGIIFLVLLCTVPYILLFKYLQKSNSAITLHPKITIKKVENKNDMNSNVVGDSIRLLDELFKKVDDIKNEGKK